MIDRSVVAPSASEIVPRVKSKLFRPGKKEVRAACVTTPVGDYYRSIPTEEEGKMEGRERMEGGEGGGGEITRCNFAD